MEFTPSQMQALATLLRPPEPEVLQGEDLQSTGTDFVICFVLHVALYHIFFTVSPRALYVL